MSRPHLVILGGGPAGLGAAYKLSQRGQFQVTVLEKNAQVGGNASSFNLAGVQVDYGSHRLHPACDPEVFEDIQALLGEDLKRRPRHGRIRLRGRWIHFPLKALDLVLALPVDFTLGVAGDTLAKALGRNANHPIGTPETFASVLEAGLGSTICRDFYFPYAHKIWGISPTALSATQAQRRVSGNSPGKILRKLLPSMRTKRRASNREFYYPLDGYGQISQAYASAAVAQGVDILLNARVEAVTRSEPVGYTIHYRQNGESGALDADHMWSTIPITHLVRSMQPAAPEPVLEATREVSYRAMILVYLILEQPRFSEFDAHYFPERQIPITRLSEPKVYSGVLEPSNRTVLCAELPCDVRDSVWESSDSELGEMVTAALAYAGIPLQARLLGVETRRLRQAYPIYRQGYEVSFDVMDRWIHQSDNLLSFGRQGLFAHDNTHHALYMAYSAVQCLDRDGNFDTKRWQSYRKVFETHVVVD